jgi:hypothetical protein
MPLMIAHSGSSGLSAVGFQQTTVSTTALSLVIPVGVTPQRALLTVNSNAVRYRTDGTNPTTTTGHWLASTGAPLELIGSKAIESFRVIRDAAADAEVAYTIEV